MYKSKYSRLFKMKLAQLYLEGKSSNELSKCYRVSKNQIGYWGDIFKLHGADSFIHIQPNPCGSYKLLVLKKMWTNNWSLGHTSAYFNLSSPGILSKWFADYRTQGLAGLEPRRKGRPMANQPKDNGAKQPEQMSEKELRAEIDYLRAENAVLKKLEALAQQKRILAKKKR
jgi:transposase